MPSNWPTVFQASRRAVAVLLLSFVAGLLPHTSFGMPVVLESRGRWLTGAAGVQTSGLTVDSDNQFWAIGDEHTTLGGVKTDARLFEITVTDTAARLGNPHEITLGGNPILYDFEDLCAFKDSHFLVVTEASPGTPKLFDILSDGKVSQSWSIVLDPKDVNSSGDPNKRLEGVTYSSQEVFFVYENQPQILVLPIAQLQKDENLKPRRLNVDLSGIKNLSGLHFIREKEVEHLLALAPEQHLLLRVDLERDKTGNVIAKGRPAQSRIRFLSPDTGNELPQAKPEGITVKNGIIWIVTDPPVGAEMIPILFNLPLSAVLSLQPPLAPQPPLQQPHLPQPPPSSGTWGQPYDTIRHDIESAGRKGNMKSLIRSISEIDRNIARVTPIEETACWQLLKATALVEIGRTSDAKAIFGALADTCPIWEALNNFAVLEAADGEFRNAREHLRKAIDRANESQEAALPTGNFRKLETEQDEVISLTLAGSAKECSPVQRAQCRPTPRNETEVNP